MKFQAHGQMRSNPGFTLTSKVHPLQCSAHVRGQAAAEVGTITLGLGEIPVRLRIPFLRRRSPVLVLGTIGPVRIKVDPFTCTVKEVALQCDGLLGAKDGFAIGTEGKMTCSTDMTVEGLATGNLSLGSIQLGDETTERAAQAKAAAR